MLSRAEESCSNELDQEGGKRCADEEEYERHKQGASELPSDDWHRPSKQREDGDHRHGAVYDPECHSRCKYDYYRIHVHCPFEVSRVTSNRVGRARSGLPYVIPAALLTGLACPIAAWAQVQCCSLEDPRPSLQHGAFNK